MFGSLSLFPHTPSLRAQGQIHLFTVYKRLTSFSTAAETAQALQWQVSLEICQEKSNHLKQIVFILFDISCNCVVK